jgi:putative endonuclease
MSLRGRSSRLRSILKGSNPLITSHCLLHEHKYKLVPGFNSKYNIQYLIYYKSTPSIHVALAREKQIKGWLRAKKIALIDSMNPAWKDLAEEWFIK